MLANRVRMGSVVSMLDFQVGDNEARSFGSRSIPSNIQNEWTTEGKFRVLGNGEIRLDIPIWDRGGYGGKTRLYKNNILIKEFLPENNQYTRTKYDIEVEVGDVIRTDHYVAFYGTDLRLIIYTKSGRSDRNYFERA